MAIILAQTCLNQVRDLQRCVGLLPPAYSQRWGTQGGPHRPRFETSTRTEHAAEDASIPQQMV